MKKITVLPTYATILPRTHQVSILSEDRLIRQETTTKKHPVRMHRGCFLGRLAKNHRHDWLESFIAMHRQLALDILGELQHD